MIWDDTSFCIAATLPGTTSGGASDGIGSAPSGARGATSVLISSVLAGSGLAVESGMSPAVACLSREARREMAATMMIQVAFCPRVGRLRCVKLVPCLTLPVFCGGNT